MKNILYPLLYLLNIAKEVIFLGFFVTVAGGSRSVLQYFNSFSSVVNFQFLTKSTFVYLNNLSCIFSSQVILCHLFSIVVPIILSGTTRLGKVSFYNYCLDVMKAPIQPIILSHKLAALKLIRKKLLNNGKNEQGTHCTKMGADKDQLTAKCCFGVFNFSEKRT